MTSFIENRVSLNRKRRFYPPQEELQAKAFFDRMIEEDRSPVMITELNREDKAHGRVPCRVDGWTVVYYEEENWP